MFYAAVFQVNFSDLLCCQHVHPGSQVRLRDHVFLESALHAAHSSQATGPVEEHPEPAQGPARLSPGDCLGHPPWLVSRNKAQLLATIVRPRAAGLVVRIPTAVSLPYSITAFIYTMSSLS